MVLFSIMGNGEVTNQDLASMIADHMESGFLDNIIDMFRHDHTLYSLVADLIQDERVRVRVGVTALMEELATSDSGNISTAVPNLLPLLGHREAVVRGDVSNLLGIIGDRSVIPLLERALTDQNPDVRLIAKEALEELGDDLSQ
jgi:HEAT repeat protein